MAAPVITYPTPADFAASVVRLVDGGNNSAVSSGNSDN